jgi:type II secretory pathway component GspD/PulD (secretin)
MRGLFLALAILLGAACSDTTAQPPPGVPRTVKIFMLKNADAEKMRGIVTTIFGREGITATVDARTNSLVVSGGEDTLKEIHKLVTELDKPATPRK